MELLKKRTGIDLVHVPYRGAPQFNAALLSREKYRQRSATYRP